MRLMFLEETLFWSNLTYDLGKDVISRWNFLEIGTKEFQVFVPMPSIIRHMVREEMLFQEYFKMASIEAKPF